MKTEIKLLNKNDFFKNINGKETTIYVLKNRNGLVSEITNYGARVFPCGSPIIMEILMILFWDLTILMIISKLKKSILAQQ